MTRLRRRKKLFHRASHSSFSTSSTPAACAAISCDRSSTVGPRPPLTITASARSPAQQERLQQALAVVADRRAPAHRQPDILELLAHVAEIGVDDLAGEDFVAGADDLDAHAAPPRSSLYACTNGPCKRPVQRGGGKCSPIRFEVIDQRFRAARYRQHPPGEALHRLPVGGRSRAISPPAATWSGPTFPTTACCAGTKPTAPSPFSASPPTIPTATRATGRAGWSPAIISRARSHAPSTTAAARCWRAIGRASGSIRRTMWW